MRQLHRVGKTASCRFSIAIAVSGLGLSALSAKVCAVINRA
ncbi:hypothetical protein V6582_05265 [Agrobacterium vitis]